MKNADWDRIDRDMLEQMKRKELQQLASSLDVPPDNRDGLSPGLWRQKARKAEIIEAILDTKPDEDEEDPGRKKARSSGQKTREKSTQGGPRSYTPWNWRDVDRPTVSVNEDRHRVDVFFPSKPPEDIRDGLKSCGFRFNGRTGAWYHKDTDKNRAHAVKYADKAADGEPVVEYAGGSEDSEESAKPELEPEEKKADTGAADADTGRSGIEQRHPENGAADWVPENDGTYIPPQPQCSELKRCLQAGDNVLLAGPSGTGKSALVRHVAAETNWPVVRVTGNGAMSKADLFGEWTVKDGETVFQYGLIPRAVTMGAILQIDEITGIDPSVLLALHELMEDGGRLTLTETGEVIKPHRNFRVVATDNTTGYGDETGLYSGCNMQNEATMQRFSAVFRIEHPGKKRENKVLKAHVPGTTYDERQKLIKLADDVRKMHQQGELMTTVSTRQLINLAAKLDRMDDGKTMRAVKVALTNRLPDADREAVLEIAQRHLGFEL